MRSVEITRAGDLSVADHLAEMRSWLERKGIQETNLHAVRVLNGRVTFSATFNQAAEADRFIRAFGRGLEF
jgi:hypothetical protein